MLKRAEQQSVAAIEASTHCCGLPLSEEEEETRRQLFLQANVTEGMKTLGDGAA